MHLRITAQPGRETVLSIHSDGRDKRAREAPFLWQVARDVWRYADSPPERYFRSDDRPGS